MRAIRRPNGVAVASAGAVGVAFGFLSVHSALVGSWINLLVWAVAGILVGLFIEQPRYATAAGLSYGFFLTASFLFFGFQGSPDKIPGFLVLSLALCALGAGCGWCLVAGAQRIKRRVRDGR